MDTCLLKPLAVSKVMRYVKFPILLLFLFVACANVFSQAGAPAPKSSIDEIYLAKDDGTGNAGEAATAFDTTDVPIHCVVILDSAESVTVKMQLVAVSVAGVKAGTKVVATSYTTKDLQNRVNFSGRPQGPWVAGRYRVDIYVDNVQVASREFAVQKATQANPNMNKPAEKSKVAGRVKKS